jgi:hypothetical protein
MSAECIDSVENRLAKGNLASPAALRNRSIPLRRIDLVEERAALFEAADVVEDDRAAVRGLVMPAMC